MIVGLLIKMKIHDFTFEQWCEKNNKKFSWISAYYYE